MRHTITTQLQLDQAVRAIGQDTLFVDGGDSVLRLAHPTVAVSCVVVTGGRMEVAGHAKVTATGHAVINARGDAVVFAYGNALVLACANANIALYGHASAHLAPGANATRLSADATVVADPDASRRLVSTPPPPGAVYVPGPATDATYLARPTTYGREPMFAFEADELARFVAQGDGQRPSSAEADVVEVLSVDRDGNVVDVTADQPLPLARTVIDGRVMYLVDARLWEPAAAAPRCGDRHEPAMGADLPTVPHPRGPAL